MRGGVTACNHTRAARDARSCLNTSRAGTQLLVVRHGDPNARFCVSSHSAESRIQTYGQVLVTTRFACRLDSRVGERVNFLRGHVPCTAVGERARAVGEIFEKSCVNSCRVLDDFAEITGCDSGAISRPVQCLGFPGMRDLGG